MSCKKIAGTLLAAVLVSMLFSMHALADYAVYSSGGDLPAGPGSSSGTPGVIYAPGVVPGHSSGQIANVVTYGDQTTVTSPADTAAQPAAEPSAPAFSAEPQPEAVQVPETAPADPEPAVQQETNQGGMQHVDGDPNRVMSNGRVIDLTKPMVALTYDDGPQTNAGNRILDVFARYGQRATFFMVGDRVPSRAAEVQRMVAEGHEVANHTYSHTYLNKVDAATIRSQVAKCNDIIEQTCGVRPTVMRLPGGNKNSTVLQNVNMPIILWNIDTLDWKTRNAQSTIGAVVGHVSNGDIVLMHELYDATAQATETIVPALVEQGFQLVTVSELAALRGINLSPNTVYYSFK